MSDTTCWLSIRVEEVDPPTCSYCALERNRVVRATHEVVVEGWYGAYAGQGRLLACERHANEAANALRKAAGKGC